MEAFSERLLRDLRDRHKMFHPGQLNIVPPDAIDLHCTGHNDPLSTR
jgi:hypothetical protein